MTPLKNKGFLAAFQNAFAGFRCALTTELNLRIHFIVAGLVILAGFIFGLSGLEWALILLMIAMVIVAELFNTAMEFTVDLANPEKHELARRAKDISAAAVLSTTLCAVLVGLILFLPKVIHWLTYFVKE